MSDSALSDAAFIEALAAKVAALGSQERVAQQVGCRQGMISRILLRSRPLSHRVARRIVRRFPELRQAAADALLAEPPESAPERELTAVGS